MMGHFRPGHFAAGLLGDGIGSSLVTPEALHPARLAVDASLVTLIWLVQLIIYPSFRSITPDAFPAFHAAYSTKISFVVIPLMLAQVLLVAAQIWRTPGPGGLVSAGLVGIAWIATFALAVPCHQELGLRGHDLDVIDRLVRVNWIRTAAWTAALGLTLRGA